MNTESENFNFKELASLIDALCDNTITPEQFKRLESLVESDERALEFYIQSMWLDEGIARHTGTVGSKINDVNFASKELGNELNIQFIHNQNQNQNQQSQNEETQMATTLDNSAAWSADPSTGTQQVSEASTKRNWPAILAMACVMSFLVGLAFIVGSKGAGGLAKNGAMTDPVYVGVEKAASENVERTELADGTVVIARKGAEYSSENTREISLTKGELYLIVAKSDQPFVVKTKDGEVKATGTRFSVSAHETTEAAVAQGTVVLTSNVGGVSIGAGQKGILAKSEKPTRSPAKRLSHLVNWAKDALKQDELLVESVPRENGLVAIDPYGQEAKLSLRKYNVDVYIEDGVARTTIDQTFFNHNPWNTEGTFYFPLPPDASVSRLAMYVAGTLNEGGMVTRERGQEIYTEILHQRRDPALLEMMEGNMFKMRIFPLEGRQEKRIFLSYTQNLDELYGTSKYWFPMEHTNDIAKQLSIRVHIKDGVKQFDPKSSTHDLKVSTAGDDLVLEYDAEKIKPDQDFLLSLLPQKEEHDSEVRVAVCEKDGLKYLSAKLRPDMIGEHKPEPRQWIVLNDVSASRSKLDAQAQKYVLERLITEADDDDSVFLIDLNTVARNVSVRPANVRSKDIKPILNHRSRPSVGATNLSAGFKAANDVVRKHKLANPHILYLGDGVATDGEQTLADLSRLVPRGCKFVGIGIGKTVDSMFLQEAAYRTGGTFSKINPNEDIDWRVFDLLAAMNTPRMTNVKVEMLDDDGELIESIAYPSSTVVADGETLTVTAMLEKQFPSTIRFEGRVGEEKVTMEAALKDAKTESEYLPRLWAKRHIDELLKSDMSDKEEIIELSKNFYVVTPYTSLIVLEDDKMYEEYNVERGRKDHWASYDAPATIDVVKEPVDWNRWNGWNWNRFSSEDGKVKTTTKPKSVQEIVDNIQIRLDAPFYLWNHNNSPGESRLGLYSLCEQKPQDQASLSKLLTFYFLLAARDRGSIVDWSREVSAVKSDANSNFPAAKPSPNVGFFASRIDSQNLFMDPIPGLSDSPHFGPFFRRVGQQQMQREFLMQQGQASSLSSLFGDMQPEMMFRPLGETRQLGGRLLTTTASAGFQPILIKQMHREGYLRGLGFVAGTPLSPISFGRVPNLFNPQTAQAYHRAVSTRMNRIERDIRKSNQQSGHWNQSWNTWSIDATQGINNWYSNGMLDVLEDLGRTPSAGNGDSNSDGVIDGLRRFDFLLEPNSLSPSFEMDFAKNSEFMFDSEPLALKERLISPSRFSIIPESVPLGRGLSKALELRDGRVLANFEAFGNTGKYSLSKFAATDFGLNYFGPVQGNLTGSFEFRQSASGPIHPQYYLASAVGPAKTNAGITSILAADHLSSRLKELKSLGKSQTEGLSKRQVAEQNAIKAAISNMEKVGATMEPSNKFWRNQSLYNQQPLIQYPKAPIVQAYTNYNWAYDLTRYAQGLNSNQTDIAHEVAQHYGTAKPNGQISDDVRSLIDKARSNFTPVSIKFHKEGNELLVGPNDQFAFSHQNEMKLTEKMICDGKNIFRIYDEIGLVAKRMASDIRLKKLRQLVPHMIPSPDSIALNFDVELVETSDIATTLKLKFPERETDLDVDSKADPTTAGKEKPSDSESGEGKVKPDVHFLVKFDNEGRILSGRLMVDGKSQHSIELSYADTKVTSKWKFKVLTKGEDGKPVESTKELEDSYLCKSFKPTEGTFKANVEEHVVLNMPLKRPAYYQSLIAKFKENESPAQKETELAISHHQHLILAHLQENTNKYWAARQFVIAAYNTMVELKKSINQTPLKGELTLYCGAGGYTNAGIGTEAVKKFEKTALLKFFFNRQQLKKEFKNDTESSLTQHLGLYNLCVNNSSDADLAKEFKTRFPDSPLMLALHWNRHGGTNRFSELLKLNEDPRWSGAALLLAMQVAQNPAQQKKLSEAFWKWQEELSEEKLEPILNPTIINVLKQADKTKLSSYLAKRLKRVEKLDSLALLMDFAEKISAWGEKELADKAYSTIRKRLKIDADESPQLLKRFALGQSLWAGGQAKKALEQFKLIQAELDEKKIDTSPAFTASMARLLAASGELSKAIEYEEKALAKEQPYLPDAINLQAFRQRYQWLWSQYQEMAKVADELPTVVERDKQINDIIERATATWERWREVDRNNSRLPVQMANLLQQAKASDERIWEYLSTVVDLKPRDAATYFQLGSWYQNNGGISKAIKWYKQAPQWDTANPQWIMSYAKALQQTGNVKAAKSEYQKVVDGKWAPGLMRYRDQAINELKNLDKAN